MNNGSKIVKIIAIIVVIELVFTMIIRYPLAKTLGLTSDFKFDLSIFEPKEPTGTTDPVGPTEPGETVDPNDSTKPTDPPIDPSSTEDSGATPTKAPTPPVESEEITDENMAKILTWDFNPNYEMLEKNEKQAYIAIYKCLAKADERAYLTQYNISTDKLKEISEAVYNDHPELFWFEGSISYSYDSSSGFVKYYSPIYNQLSFNLDKNKAEFDKCAEEYLAAAKAETKGAVYQELVVHNMICKAVTYDLKSDYNQSAYSAIVKGRTVCAGYSRAFQYLMLKLGIHVYYLSGEADNGKQRDSHAWNIIELDGKTYNVDVTWDDTDNKQVRRFDYFNITDSKISKDHFRDEQSKKMPECTSDDMTYEKIAAA